MNDLRKNFFITLGTIVAVFLCLFGAFIYLFVGIISPLSAEFRQVQENIKIAEERINDFRGRVEPALARETEDMKKIEESYFVYSQDTAKDFIIFLETAAKRNRLTGEITSLPQVTTPTASMNLSGAFDDAILFLREIENGSLLLGIDSVSIRGSGGTVSFSVQMRLPLPPQTL